MEFWYETEKKYIKSGFSFSILLYLKIVYPCGNLLSLWQTFISFLMYIVSILVYVHKGAEDGHFPSECQRFERLNVSLSLVYLSNIWRAVLVFFFCFFPFKPESLLVSGVEAALVLVLPRHISHQTVILFQLILLS